MNSSERSLLDGRGMRRTSIVFAIVLACGASTVRAQQNDQQQPPVRTSPPFPNRANEALPPWLRVRGEFRERFEGFAHSGFTPERDDSYFLSRLRINAVVTPSRLFSATVQLQDARVAQKEVGPTTPAIPRPARPAHGLCRHRRRAEGRRLGPCGPAGARVRRAAADRAPQLDQYRAELRRRTGHDSARRVSGRRVRRIGRADRGRLVRRKRQRQSTRRRLRLALGARAQCGRRALLLLARRPRPAHRKRDDRRPQSEDDWHALQREAAGRTRLRDRDRRADGLSRLRLDRRLGRALAAPRVVRRQPESPADRRVQLRERRRRTQPTARAGRSISCIRPATTSWASPIRSDGATSVMLAPASRSRRCADGR